MNGYDNIAGVPALLRVSTAPSFARASWPTRPHRSARHRAIVCALSTVVFGAPGFPLPRIVGELNRRRSRCTWPSATRRCFGTWSITWNPGCSRSRNTAATGSLGHRRRRHAPRRPAGHLVRGRLVRHRDHVGGARARSRRGARRARDRAHSAARRSVLFHRPARRVRRRRHDPRGSAARWNDPVQRTAGVPR